MSDVKDLIILGNGMAGMTAALYAKRANLDFKIVGRDEYDFGQISNAILVENFPCVNSQSGFDLADKLHDQLLDNHITIEEHTVVKLSRKYIANTNPKESEYLWEIIYSDNTTDLSRTVIYALGASHRKLDCEIGDNVQIHYCALCDGALYRDKTVAIVGGGDVAFTQAEYLSKICTEVWIIMCDRNVTAAPSTFERVNKIDNIKIIYDYPIECIKKCEDGKYRLKRAYARDSGLITEGIFVAIGMVPNTEPLREYELDKNGYIDCNDDNLSSIHYSSLFGAGDVRTKQVRQAITAANDGAIAVNSVVNYLNNLK